MRLQNTRTWIVASAVLLTMAAGAGADERGPRDDRRDEQPERTATLEQIEEAMEDVQRELSEAAREMGYAREGFPDAVMDALADAGDADGLPFDALPRGLVLAASEMVEQTFLGVSTSPVGETLGKQLGLAEGVGMVIDHVEPNSPAANAGLEKHDVLHKLDDQLVINTPQLSVLLNMHDGGDKVKITVIRGGKSKAIPVTLERRKVRKLTVSKEIIERMFRPRMKVPEELRRRPREGDSEDRERREGSRGRKTVGSMLSMDHGGMSVRMKVTGNKATLHVTDKDGKEIYSGPVKIDESGRVHAPEGNEKVRKVLERMHRMKIRIRDGGITTSGDRDDEEDDDDGEGSGRARGRRGGRYDEDEDDEDDEGEGFGRGGDEDHEDDEQEHGDPRESDEDEDDD